MLLDLPDNFQIRFEGSEMAGQMRSHDWAATSLGPPAQWPESLRLALELCLASHFPMVIWWGADLIQFYNDAYRPILGRFKHSGALGRPARETWSEIWPTIGIMESNALDQSLQAVQLWLGRRVQ